MTSTITLGGREFEVRPLKLRQLRGLLDALDALAGKSGGDMVDAAADVVAAGIAAAHPDATADMVLDIEATVDDLNKAVAEILKVAGLRPGEAEPPMAAASERNSPKFTAPSPPAADTAMPTSAT